MENNSTFDILVKGFQRLNLDNDWDRLVYPNFKGTYADDKKRFLDIPQDEKIAYIRGISTDKSCPIYLAITDKGIYYKNVYFLLFKKVINDSWSVKFSAFNNVTYSDDKSRFIFSNGAEMGKNEMVKKLDLNGCIEFAKILSQAANNEEGFEESFKRGRNQLENGELDEALKSFEKAKSFLHSDDEFGLTLIYNNIGLVLNDKEEYKQAKINFDTAIEIAKNSNDPDVRDLLPRLYANQSHSIETGLEAYLTFLKGFSLEMDIDEKKELTEELNNLINSDFFRNELTNSENKNSRKTLLYIGSDNLPIYSESIVCVNNEILKQNNISFPLGHPIKGQIYVVHPVKDSYYIPYEIYEEEIFFERVSEFCYLLQSLGASEIEIKSTKGKTLDTIKKGVTSGNLNFDYKLFNADFSASEEKETQENYRRNFSFETIQKFLPQKAPHIPPDLNWLKIDSKWQRLIDARLQGNLSVYSENISTSEFNAFSRSEEFNINADLKILLTKLSGSLKINTVDNNEKKENTEWKIIVKFSTESKNSKENVEYLNDTEKEYIEKVKECLDGQNSISDNEKNLLIKIASLMGISEKRAEELNKYSINRPLSNAEKNYMEAYKNCLTDKTMLSSIERRLLNQLASSLNIDANRIAEIENLI